MPVRNFKPTQTGYILILLYAPYASTIVRNYATTHPCKLSSIKVAYSIVGFDPMTSLHNMWQKSIKCKDSVHYRRCKIFIAHNGADILWSQNF